MYQTIKKIVDEMTVQTPYQNKADVGYTAVKRLQFTHGEKSFLSAISDQSNFPLCFLNVPILSRVSIAQSGYIGRKFPIQLYWLWKSSLNWSPKEHSDLAIRPARAAADNFMSRCQSSDDINSISEISDMEVFNFLPVNTSGLILNITVEPTNFKGVCVD